MDSAVYHGTCQAENVRIRFRTDQQLLLEIAFRADDSTDDAWTSINPSRIISIQNRDKDSTVIAWLQVDRAVEKPHPSQLKYETLTCRALPDELSLAIRSTTGTENVLHALLSDYEGRPSEVNVIVSTSAGTGHAKTFFERAVQPALHGCSLHVHYTTSDQSVAEFARSQILPVAQAGKSQLVVLLSGDGGVIDVLNAVLEETHTKDYHPPAVAVLALGTGNALANSSSCVEDATLGLRSLVNGASRPLPILRVDFSPGAQYVIDEGRNQSPVHIKDGRPTAYGAVVCSWGLHAALVADSDTVEYRKHGAERFQMAAKENLFPSDGSSPHRYCGSVKYIPEHGTDWVSLGEGEHTYVLATFMSQLEKGFTISPESKPLDGKLRLIRIGSLSGQEIMAIMEKAYQGGKHVHDEQVEYKAIKALRIDFDEQDARWRRVCIDGTIIKVDEAGWLEIHTDVEPPISLVTCYALLR